MYIYFILKLLNKKIATSFKPFLPQRLRFYLKFSSHISLGHFRIDRPIINLYSIYILIKCYYSLKVINIEKFIICDAKWITNFHILSVKKERIFF